MEGGKWVNSHLSSTSSPIFLFILKEKRKHSKMVRKHLDPTKITPSLPLLLPTKQPHYSRSSPIFSSQFFILPQITPTKHTLK